MIISLKLKVQSIPGVPIPPRGGHLLGIILGCVFLGWKLSGRRSIPLPVPIFCSLSYASCASPTWLKIGEIISTQAFYEDTFMVVSHA